jgi:hypothetical protein
MRLLTPDVLNFVKNSIVYSIYQWNDPNGNDNYDAGEINSIRTGPISSNRPMEFGRPAPNLVNKPRREATQDR